MYYMKIYKIVTTLEEIVIVNPNYALCDNGKIWLFGIDGAEYTTEDFASIDSVISVTIDTVCVTY